MLAKRQWGSRTFSATDLGTTIEITKLPKQYPVRKILVTLRATWSVTAGGTTDYVTGEQFTARILESYAFSLGSGNYLKDNIPGYAALYNTIKTSPNIGAYSAIGPGTTVGVGDSVAITLAIRIDFEDRNTLPSGLTILNPSLYEDMTLDLNFAPLADLVTAGDRPYTFDGILSVVVVQDKNLMTTPNDVLREWTETTAITSTGNLEIDLPRSMLIEQINIFPIENDIPSNDPIDFDQTVQISVESGTVIPIEMYPQDLLTDIALDYKTIDLFSAFTGINSPFFSINLDGLHDGQRMFDNRLVTKWQLILGVNYNIAFTRRILLHYIGRNQMPPQMT